MTIRAGLIGLTVTLMSGLALAQTVSSPPGLNSRSGTGNQIKLGGSGGGSGGSGSTAPSSGLVSSLTAETTLRILKDIGIEDLRVDSNDIGPYLIGKIGETDVYVWHENCQDKVCVALNFAAYLGKQDDVSDSFIHDYNRNMIFTKMAKDKDGELQITMGVSVSKGVSEDHIRAMGELWVEAFKEALDYKPEGK